LFRPPAPPKHQHPGGHCEYRVAAGLGRSPRNEHHQTGIRPRGRNRIDDVIAQDRLTAGALGVDNRTFAGDGDRFRERTHFEIRVHRCV